MKIQIHKTLSEDMKAPYYKRVKGIHEKNKKILIGFGVGADENRGPFKTDRSMGKKGKSAPPGAAGGGSLEEVLAEGGVAGHMNHLYDNPDITFSQIKDIFNKASAGELEGTEKTDGQNLQISFSVPEQRAKAARNKGNIKAGGLTSDELKTKFAGRGPLEETFADALQSFEELVKTLPQEQQVSIFGPNTEIYYNAEVQDPRTANVIYYDSPNLVIHQAGHAKYNRETGDKEEVDVSQNAAMLNDLLQKQQSSQQSKFKVQSNAVRKLQAISDKSIVKNYITRLDQEISKYGISDNQKLKDYEKARLRQIIKQEFNIELNDEQFEMISTKMFGETSENINQVVKRFPPEIAATVKTIIASKDLLGKAVRPIEVIIHDFAVEILKGLESAFVLDNKKEVKRLKDEVADAINQIQQSGQEEAITILNKQLEKLKTADNVYTAAEGFVFQYDDVVYKFTGNFAPINQILGLFKYGRGSVPAIKKQINESTEAQNVIVVFPGSFKPPHKGHIGLVDEVSHISGISKVVVLISDPVQETSIRTKDFGAKEVKLIFDLYSQVYNFGCSVDFDVANAPSPLTAAYKYLETENFQPGTKVLFATSKADAGRYPQTKLDKSASKNPSGPTAGSIELPEMIDPDTGKKFSATNMREILADPNADKQLLKRYMPNELPDEDKEMVIDMLTKGSKKQEIEKMVTEILAEMLGLSEKKDMICDGTMCNEVHDGMSHKEYESYLMQEKEGEDDRCTRIAKRKYDAWPSAYASGAVVRCRRGEIWKGEK